jgi:hypothetical protein
MTSKSGDSKPVKAAFEAYKTSIQDFEFLTSGLRRALKSAWPDSKRDEIVLEALVSDIVAYVNDHNRGWPLDVLEMKGAALALLKRMEADGLGRLLLGRRGAKTRFSVKWEVRRELIDVLESLRNEDASDEQTSQRQPGDVDTGVDSPARAVRVEGSEPANIGEHLAHQFNLRPGVVVQFRLPSNLTTLEAQRLARFIEALPFE